MCERGENELEHLFPRIGSGFWSLNLTVAAMILVASLITFLIARLAVARMDVRKPAGMQNFLEWLVDFVRGLAKDFIPAKYVDKVVPLAATLMLYIFIANQMGVIFNVNTEIHAPIFGVSQEEFNLAKEVSPHVSVGWWLSPTANTSVTIALALGVFILSHAIGLRRPGKYLKHYFEPNPALFLMNVIEEVSKPVTHALRLWGNIFAGEVLIAIIMSIPLVFGFVPVGAVPLIIWLAYSLFVGSIQAFVFTILTLLYVGQKLPQDNH